MLKLYSYYRSSAAYRVRIALNLKQVPYQIVPVNLLDSQHKQPSYLQKQPQGLVPCLETVQGDFLSQSGAIIDYIQKKYPSPPLTSDEPLVTANIRGVCDIIACDIHPICNLRVLNYLTDKLDVDSGQKLEWYQHWISQGFYAVESMLDGNTYCFSDRVTLADVYLIPQVYNALRFNCDMQDYPKIMSIYHHCNQLDAFIHAMPENQPDVV